MSRKRTNTVRLVAPAGVGLAVNGFDAHLRHQRPDVLTPNSMPARRPKNQSPAPAGQSLHADLSDQASPPVSPPLS